jgi:hypothetical protein
VNRYALNGLSVDSAMELGKPSLATFADLTLVVGDTAPVPESVPAGELLAEFALDGRPIYSAADDGRHFVLRLHELCDFVVEHDLARAECRPADEADPEILALVVRGALSAFVLGLRGEASLHASAVDWRADGRAVAFVGNSGSGKSTVAALMALGGSPFITDDLLRLSCNETAGWVGGCEEVRLRAGAAGLASSVREAWQGRESVDGRLALRPPATTFDSGPLAAVIFPVLVEPGGLVESAAVHPMEATLLMSTFHRLAGWRSEAVLKTHLDAVALIAENVPVRRLTVPWDPARALDLARQVRHEVGAWLG